MGKVWGKSVGRGVGGGRHTLPAPLGPSKPKHSPLSTAMVKLRTACLAGLPSCRTINHIGLIDSSQEIDSHVKGVASSAGDEVKGAVHCRVKRLMSPAA